MSDYNIMTSAKRYPLSPHPIFWSYQGEAHLRGFGMVFLRLAGCSVGCAECDTDYRVAEIDTAESIAARVLAAFPRVRDRWVWITGGEPCDHDLKPLLKQLSLIGVSTCVATSGKHRHIPPCDWLSVSYHGGYPLKQAYGSEIKIVPGLNGLDPWKFIKDYPDDQTDFMYRYVQPLCIDGAECEKSKQTCLDFVKDNPNWSLSRQDHKFWGLA